MTNEELAKQLNDELKNATPEEILQYFLQFFLLFFHIIHLLAYRFLVYSAENLMDKVGG